MVDVLVPLAVMPGCAEIVLDVIGAEADISVGDDAVVVVVGVGQMRPGPVLVHKHTNGRGVHVRHVERRSHEPLAVNVGIGPKSAFSRTTSDVSDGGSGGSWPCSALSATSR